jgi:hypothetical protein
MRPVMTRPLRSSWNAQVGDALLAVRLQRIAFVALDLSDE